MRGKIIKTILLSLMVLFVCVIVQADSELIDTQKNATATNLGLYGSYTWDMAVDPTDNNYIYLASYYAPNGFYRSSDGGLTWKGLPADTDHGAGREVEVNPSNGHVYALLNDLLVSTDHGNTYTVAYEFGTNGWSLLYAQNTLLVSTSNGEVYRSMDEGVNFSSVVVCSNQAVWSLASAGDSFYALCHDYSAGTSALFTSIDGGASWTDLEIAVDGVSGAEVIAVNPVNNYMFLIPSSTGGTTYRSIDGGFTWTALVDPPLTGHMNFNSTGRAYVGWYYSNDNGDNWTSFGRGGSYNHFIMPDPTNDAILYDTSVPGFNKSTDSGATWLSSVEGIMGVEVTAISQAADKNIVWVATQNGPAMTNNFLDENPTWQYMPTTTTYISSGYDGIWVKSTDPNIVVAGSSRALHYSTDAGVTWSQATADIAFNGAVFQIVNDIDGNLYAVIGPNISTGSQNGGVIKSTDNGATWISLGFPNDGAVRSLAVAANGDIYAGAHSSVNGVYKYSNNTWAKLTASDDEYVAVLVDPQDDNTIYVLGKNVGVYKSTDAGETWKEKNEGLGDIDQEFMEFNTLAIQTSTDPNSLYISGVKQQTMKGVIYKSSNGAEDWAKLYTGKSGETFNALLFDGLVAGNSRGIYNLKSRADLTIKKKVNLINFTLKDAATERILKHKKIKIYKKKNNSWHYWKNVRTNIKGRASIPNNLVKTTTIKAVWTPKGNFVEEYVKTLETKKIKI